MGGADTCYLCPSGLDVLKGLARVLPQVTVFPFPSVVWGPPHVQQSAGKGTSWFSSNRSSACPGQTRAWSWLPEAQLAQVMACLLSLVFSSLHLAGGRWI